MGRGSELSPASRWLNMLPARFLLPAPSSLQFGKHPQQTQPTAKERQEPAVKAPLPS